MRRTLMLAGLLVLGGLSIGATKTKSADENAVGPKSPEDYMTLVSTFVDIGQLDNAEATALEGKRKFPNSAGFHFMLGYVEYARRNWAESFYHLEYEKLKVGAGRDLGAQCALLSSRIVQNERGQDVDEARRVLKALSDRKDPKKQLSELLAVEKFRGQRPVLSLWIAEAKARNNDDAGAAKIYRSLITSDRMFVPAYVGLAAISKKESPALLAKARAVDPDHWALPK